ncbi:MAG: N-acetylmuramoyl-L-alanine amidase, partial [Arenicellales bacterium]
MCVCRRSDLRRSFLTRALEAIGAIGVATILPGATFASETALISAIRGSTQGGVSHVDIVLSGPVDHHVFTLKNPDRVVIDLEPSTVARPLGLQGAAGSVVERLRYATHPSGRVRLVLDLRGTVHPVATLLPPAAGHPDYRLLVTLNAPGAGAQPQKTVLRDVVVVIDPGHGGHDPGAIGRRGTREKDVVLPISLRLADLLSGEKGFRTVLTRDRDVFLPLRERIRIAGEHKADLFVSIHADASTDRAASGSTVYILSKHGASSERARRVAERENMAGSGREVKL